MDKNRLYAVSEQVGGLLWGIIALVGFISTKMWNLTLLRITAYLLILLGLYYLAIYFYFKKAPVLMGVSDKSKIAIVGNFIICALLFLGAISILIYTKNFSP